jgi:putative sigma-54 modulation protein
LKPSNEVDSKLSLNAEPKIESKERRLTMEVEFTARQVKISKALRTQAEEGLQRISRILGKTATASITFGEQKRQQIVELTIQARLHTVVATGKAESLESALRQALVNAENQARRHRDRRLERNRLPTEEKEAAAPPITRSKTRVAKTAEPDSAKVSRKAVKMRPVQLQPHVLKASEAIASKPLTLEEAVKEAESSDRDLLIYRNKSGDTFVLHRRRDGQMELVEIS